MNRQKALRALNPLLFVLLLYQGVTGVFRFSFYDHFKLMHPVAGMLLLAAGGVHLFLNWPWVRANYGHGGRKT